MFGVSAIQAVISQHMTNRPRQAAIRRAYEEPIGMAEVPLDRDEARIGTAEDMAEVWVDPLQKYRDQLVKARLETLGDSRMADAFATTGRKDDQSKDRFELLPGDALRAIAVILTFGAAKYGDRNWEKGMKWSRVYGATQRHLTAWWEGEKLDAETGKSHLWHAGCCILFLIAYEIRSVGEDDRPVTPRSGP